MQNKLVSIIIPIYNQEKLIVRALDSIPKRDDIEVICIDDCSTDNTWNVLNNYNRIPLKLFRNNKNIGTGASTNIGYNNAKGQWIIGLDNDDYFITNEFNKAINILNQKYDMIFISNRVNDGSIWDGEDRTAIWSYFIKKDFLKNYRMPETRWAADFDLTKSLMKLKPKIYNTKICAYHYNYPREGSIVWNHTHKIEK